MPAFKLLVPVVQKMDNAIYRINHYPVDSAVCIFNTYPLECDLSGMDSVIHLLNNWALNVSSRTQLSQTD